MADFLMPALGADMESGKLVQWLVQPGSPVKRGDVVAVVETHKGAIDVEIFLDGVIEDLVPVGTELPVGSVLARVRESGAAATVAAPVPAPAKPFAAATAVAPPAVAPGEAPSAPAGPRAKVSPAARQRARELGIDAASLVGTGAQGAVSLADVERAAPRAAGVTAQRPAAAAFDPAPMRAAIAAAMSRSKREIPHYYLASSIDFGAAGEWLARYNAGQPPAQRLLAAVLLLKATARALVDVPQLNGFYRDGGFHPGAGIHVGWAISMRGGGLVAPALHDVDRKPLPQLMDELRSLVQRARTGGLRSSEVSDPTVTVTSLGERGAESVLGVIYPPQVAIVGFGRVADRPWVHDGAVRVRPVLQASLAADHRVSDGHLGGQLLAAIDSALQQPGSL